MKLVLIVPAYNEADVLEANVAKLSEYLRKNISIESRIVVSAYRSGNEMEEAGKKLAKMKDVIYFSTEKRGRGIALIEAHRKFAENGDWVGYVDVDIPVELEKFKDVEKCIKENNADLIVGCRYGKGKITGSLKRKILSMGYITLANVILFGGMRVPDFQAGFKFWRKELLDEILIKEGNLDDKWFFDTQLMYYAHKLGKKIAFVPVEYRLAEQEKSTVNSFRDSISFFSNLVRFRLGK